MNASRESRIVVDGCSRARAAAEPKVRADVERQYADRLATASMIQRWRLKLEMKKQIAEQLAKIAPPDALY